MSTELQDAIRNAVTAMLIKFNNRLSKNQMEPESKLADWAEFLAFEKGFTVSQVMFALTELTKTNKTFMPSAYEIADALAVKTETKEDRAPIIAKEIFQLIRSFHQDLEAQMLEKASPDARLVFLAIGNTSDIRNSENFETTNAQVERLIRGVLAAKVNDIKNEKLEKIGIETGRVLHLRTVDFSGYLPEGA
jgi:hypothetical protein